MTAPKARHRRRGWLGSDAGSLPTAVLLTMLGISLSALLLPMVVTQVQSTRAEIQRGHSLYAAQAGLEVALGTVRAATDASGAGVLAELPCAPITGQVGGGGGRYHVTVDYFAFDPRGKSDGWLAGNRLACPASGPVPVLPAFVLLRSHGTDQATGDVATAPGRTVRATYTLQTTNENIPGGLIHLNQSTLCLAADSPTPATGNPARLRTCAPGDPTQAFAYNQNLTLVLVSSKTPANPFGMCLDAATPAAAGTQVLFRPCGNPNTVPRQQWSFNDNARFQGTTNGTSLNGQCFRATAPINSGTTLELGNCNGGYDGQRTFLPEPPVGAGAAGTPASGQVVNYDQFGRCLDVTNQQVNSPHLIAWPCKQAPIPTNVTWNQRWEQKANADGTVRLVTDPNTDYCLRSPLSTGGYVTVTATSCGSANPPAALRWTFTGDTGVYETSYRIQDSAGYCLAPTDPDATPADLFHKDGLTSSKVIVAPCTSALAQKWNAPANLINSVPLKDFLEE